MSSVGAALCRRKMKPSLKALMGILALLVSLQSSYSYALMQITPLRFELSSGVRGGSFTVTNLSSVPNRIEFTAIEKIGDVERDATDEFVIFPPLRVLEVGASQVVRFQFVGDKASEERRFYIIANELTPQLVTTEEIGAAATQINVLVRMGVLVRVAPNL